MAGLYLGPDPSTTGEKNTQIAPLSFVGGNGFVVFQADKNIASGSNHVNFKLGASAQYILLSNNDPSITQIDAVSFGQQTTDVTMGRIPDGSSNIVSMPGSPTPGAKNILLPAPSISGQPSSQTVSVGANNVTFTVNGSGSAPLNYQWTFNNTAIPSATSPTLTLNNVSIANDGAYACVLSNTAGSLTSNTATLIVQSVYSDWEFFYFGNSSNGGPNSSPLGDGVPNLLKFFADVNPLQPMSAADRSALPQVGVSPATGAPAFVTIAFRQSARANLTGVALQASNSLAPTSFSTVTPDGTQNLGNDPATGDPIFLWKSAVPPGQTQKFLRLQITQ
jgi:hypothetical protein